MSSESRIQIAPGVVFSATVFTPVQLSRCTSVQDGVFALFVQNLALCREKP
jgi:hypothetical protein